MLRQARGVAGPEVRRWAGTGLPGQSLSYLVGPGGTVSVGFLRPLRLGVQPGKRRCVSQPGIR